MHNSGAMNVQRQVIKVGKWTNLHMIGLDILMSSTIETMLDGDLKLIKQCLHYTQIPLHRVLR